MSSYLKAAIENREREVEGLYKMAGEQVRGPAGGVYGGDRSGGGSSSGLLQGSGNKFSEQYSHYKSWPYVAIRAISHRCAGQQIFMARRAAGSASERARFIMSQKGNFDMKKMRDWESEKLPNWIKGHMGFEGEMITRHELLDAIQRPNRKIVLVHQPY